MKYLPAHFASVFDTHRTCPDNNIGSCKQDVKSILISCSKLNLRKHSWEGKSNFPLLFPFLAPYMNTLAKKEASFLLQARVFH
jgi:hypothetical protein